MIATEQKPAANWIHNRFAQFGDRPMAVNGDGEVTYAGFLARVADWRDALAGWGVTAGDRVGLVADYHIDVVALVQALIDTGCIVIPLSEDDATAFPERLETACATVLLRMPQSASITPADADCRRLARTGPAHPLMQPMVDVGRPGFVIFTSGSTGKSKAVLLDHARMVRKFADKIREGMRTLLFLRLDHIGGLNTLFAVMLNGGTLITCDSRQARAICACIERHRVELLPTTPSFLTMLLMSGVHREHDLSSLRVITYGTEAMPDSTLTSLHHELPGVRLKQTYGLSELGILATRSRDSSSRWMTIGGPGYELDVRNGILWIRSENAMLGYLNAPSPFDADGWYDTGDRVEVDGEYFRIQGRESEVINVAGEKVFPVEVESFLLTLDNVRDVIVRAKPSPVVGQMVWAECLLERKEDAGVFRRRVLEACRGQLAPFKVPGFITIAGDDSLVGSRFKKIRRNRTAGKAASGVTGE